MSSEHKIQAIKTLSIFQIFLNAKRILKNPLPFHRENFEKYGNFFRLHLGFGRHVIFTKDAGFTRHMLQKNHRNYIKSPLQTKELARYIGKGLLTINGETWLKQRRLIQPAFHKKQLVLLLEGMQLNIEKQLEQIIPNKAVSILPIMGDLAFNVVAKALFTYDDKKGYIPQLKHTTELAQQALVKELRQPYKRWWFHISGQIASIDKRVKGSRDILQELITDRRKSDGTYNDLLDMLLSARYEDGSAMHNEQLIDEILVLFVAGHETTANALTFALLLLALHPEKQDKVIKEAAAWDNNKSILENIQALSYTMEVLEETMRLYPPAYFSDRVNLDEDKFEGITFKKGTQFLISFYEIHRDETFWEHATDFKPERFSLDRKKEYAEHYFPFGAGPRKCIGNMFALYEMVLVLAQIFKKYNVSTPLKEISINPLITLKPDASSVVFQLHSYAE